MFLKGSREKKIAELLSKGYRNKDIADELFVAVVTVRKAIDKIKKNNNFSSRIQIAVEYGKQFGEIFFKEESNATQNVQS